VGTGGPETSKHEWAEHQARDTITSYLGHAGTATLLSVLEGTPPARMRAAWLDRMVAPCGPVPEVPAWARAAGPEVEAAVRTAQELEADRRLGGK
jgi:splicing factor 3B subunit 5